jgi:osmoprotectant transport system permease protein
MRTSKPIATTWPLLISVSGLGITALYLDRLSPFFHWLFPDLDRVIYQQTTFVDLLFSHVLLVVISGLISMVIGCGLGLFASSAFGRDFRPLIETLVSMGQTFPPIAVLAITMPIIGLGYTPALIALVLYGVLPILEATLVALAMVPSTVLEAGRAMGMTTYQQCVSIQLPLALPSILAGIRVSVSINIGTTAVASVVGVKTLGLPIIVGLSGFNTAYVIQGTLIITLLAITTDLALEQVQRRLEKRPTRRYISH